VRIAPTTSEKARRAEWRFIARQHIRLGRACNGMALLQARMSRKRIQLFLASRDSEYA